MNLIKNQPLHVGLIIDGNGRWATKKGKDRLYGHKHGLEKIIYETVNWASEFQIKYLTLYVFSTENWKRSQHEIDGLFNLIREYADEILRVALENNVKVLFLGDLTKLPEDVQKTLLNIYDQTQNCSNFTLSIAINYGARDEICRAVNNILKSGKTEINQQTFESFLYTAAIPDPDLIIRTGGEKRLSNFLLYQSAYTELYFTKTFWPAFTKKHFKKAIKNYSKRDRRYGGDHTKKQEKK